MKKEYVEKRRKNPLYIIAGLAFVVLGLYELKNAYFDKYLPEVEFKENAVVLEAEITELVSSELAVQEGDEDGDDDYDCLYQTYIVSYDLNGQTYSTEMTECVDSIELSSVKPGTDVYEELSPSLHETGETVTIAVDSSNPQTVKSEFAYEYSGDTFYLLIPAMYIFAGLFLFLL